jgi:hypothetical protein
MSVSIIVPWRDKGDIWRKANLTRVLLHLNTIDLAPVMVIDDGATGPFNRSAAYNRGMDLAPADIYIFHEADMLVSAAQLEHAVMLAQNHLGLVVPFDTYHYLSQEDTSCVRSGIDARYCTPERVMANGRSVGAVNVVSAHTMAAVGRWDEHFTGWGYDDRAMARAFEVATQSPTRYVEGVGVHLYHTPGWSSESRFAGGAEISTLERRATEANELRYNKYRNAKTPQRIRELTS